jgi:nitrite reductase (NADH) small subunit
VIAIAWKGREGAMAQWVRLCGVGDAPAEGNVCEQKVGELEVCLARLGGELKAVDNFCPHRRGPLGQGWIEGNGVVCPWHSWVFEYPEGEKVGVFAVKVDGNDVLVEVE